MAKKKDESLMEMMATGGRHGDAQTVANLALALGAGSDVINLAGRGPFDRFEPLIVIPESDGTKVTMKVEPLIALRRTEPAGIQRKAAFDSPDSFCLYVRDFLKKPDQRTKTRVYGRAPQIEAVLDDHGPDAPSFCDHRAVLALKPTAAWAAWRAAALGREPMTQLQFVEFLEDRAEEIVKPTSAEVLTAAADLESKQNVKFRQSLNLRNGVRQFEFVEEEQPGMMKLPEQVKIKTAIYEDGDEFEITVRLRYAIREGKLSFRVVITNIERIEREAFISVCEAVEKTLTTPVLLGAV